METTDSAYPVRFDIDYPEEPRNRLTVAFRLILVIPILAVIAAIGAPGSSSGDPTSFMCIAAGVLFLPSSASANAHVSRDTGPVPELNPSAPVTETPSSRWTSALSSTGWRRP